MYTSDDWQKQERINKLIKEEMKTAFIAGCAVGGAIVAGVFYIAILLMFS